MRKLIFLPKDGEGVCMPRRVLKRYRWAIAISLALNALLFGVLQRAAADGYAANAILVQAHKLAMASHRMSRVMLTQNETFTLAHLFFEESTVQTDAALKQEALTAYREQLDRFNANSHRILSLNNEVTAAARQIANISAGQSGSDLQSGKPKAKERNRPISKDPIANKTIDEDSQ